ncbi:MAG: hypothetical protein U7123_08460 [Potamolinea sp.]
MTSFDELLKSFQPTQPEANDFTNLFDPALQQREPTPEENDLERLEADIKGIFATRQLLNQALQTFCVVAGSSATLHLFARLGIPAVATGTMGGIVLALVFANALTKISISQGRPTLDNQFFLALSQALGVTGAMWVGGSEKHIQDLAAKGRNEFLTEVRNFEVKPQPTDFGRVGMAGIGIVLLLIAIALVKGGKRNAG